MNEYTKGKWFVAQEHYPPTVWSIDKHNIIAEVNDIGFEEEAKANAQLIAKAPYHYERCKKLEKINTALYEALKEISDIVGNMFLDSDSLDFGGRKISVGMIIKSALAQVEK